MYFMVDKVPGTPPYRPQEPAPQQAGAATPFSKESDSKGDALASWKQMFGGQATDAQVKQIMDKVINDTISNFKRQEAHSKELRKKLQRDEEGN
jgi:hypothetical protein